MASEQLYVPNVSRKWVSIDYPRLTGKSISMIENYFSQFEKGDRYVPGSTDDKALGEFLIALLYSRLSGRYLSMCSNNILTEIMHPLVYPKKWYESVNHYYEDQKFGVDEISILVGRALEEGYMTYDEAPFDDSIILNADGISTYHRTVYEWIEDVPHFGSIMRKNIPEEFWEIYYVFKSLFGPTLGWNFPHDWNEILFSIINESNVDLGTRCQILERLDDIVQKYIFDREIDLSQFGYMRPDSETPGLITVTLVDSFD